MKAPVGYSPARNMLVGAILRNCVCQLHFSHEWHHGMSRRIWCDASTAANNERWIWLVIIGTDFGYPTPGGTLVPNLIATVASVNGKSVMALSPSDRSLIQA